MNNHNGRTKPLVVLISTFVLLSACNKDHHNHPELHTGKDLFNYHCASCHGEEGTGQFLRGIPANIATSKNQTGIMLHIKEGAQSATSTMPIFKMMPDQEAQKIAAYLLRLKQHYFNNPQNRDKLLLQRPPKQ